MGVDEIHELPTPKTVTYRVYDCFLEVLPRRHRLLLNLNLDFEACDDPTGRIEDGATYSFIVNATQPAGVLYTIYNEDHLDGAMRVIRQAFEAVAE